MIYQVLTAFLNSINENKNINFQKFKKMNLKLILLIILIISISIIFSTTTTKKTTKKTTKTITKKITKKTTQKKTTNKLILTTTKAKSNEPVSECFKSYESASLQIGENKTKCNSTCYFYKDVII